MSAADKKFRQALASHQSGDFAAAEKGYRQILVRTPLDVTALYHLGVVLHQQARTEEARKTLIRAVAIAPDSPDAHFSLGLVSMDLRRNDEAETALRKVISLRPDMQKALLRLGELLVLQKKYSEAVPLLQRAIQLRDNDRKAWVALSLALRRLDLFEEAIEANYRVLALEDSEDGHSLMADLIYLLYLNNPESARQHASRWISSCPDSSFARHIASGVLGTPAPDRASNDYVKKLFDNFAESFEEQLDSLGYRAQDIVGTLADLNDSEGGLVILDAGCGTGLAAASLRPAASRLVGVDISPRMLEKAQEKGVYDELVEMELGEFLKSNKAAFDLIVASDVLNYFGNLAPILDDVAQALRPGGRLVFNAECGEEGHSFTLGPHGRYSHGKGYIVEIIKQSGLRLDTSQEIVLRKEFGKEVNAFLILATKPA